MKIRFIFLVRLLLQSCKSSRIKILPPVNWYYLINSWIKSSFGKDVEKELIELSILQINHLNSAFLLIKNYLIDTNYFNNFESNTKIVVFDSFCNLCNRLNLELLKKFLMKMKIFLKHNEMNSEYLSIILKNIFNYFDDFNDNNKENKNEISNIKHEIMGFFEFIFIDFEYDLEKEDHVCFLF
jgi:hypothetical protein